MKKPHFIFSLRCVWLFNFRNAFSLNWLNGCGVSGGKERWRAREEQHESKTFGGCTSLSLFVIHPVHFTPSLSPHKYAHRLHLIFSFFGLHIFPTHFKMVHHKCILSLLVHKLQFRSQIYPVYFTTCLN